MKLTSLLCHFIILFAGATFISGCGQQTHDPYFLELAETNPPCPAVLALGQKLNVTVAYEIPSDSHVLIWARPFINNQRTPGYSAHHLIPVNGAEKEQGFVETWFFFDSPAEIDEVRIFMKPVDSDEIIQTVSCRLDAAWQ